MSIPACKCVKSFFACCFVEEFMEVVFPTVYGLCSCIKKMLIPPAGKRFERCNFLVLRPVLLKNAYFGSPNRELSEGLRLMELG